MEKKINSFLLKITDSAELSGELDDTQTVKISDADLDIYSITDKNNDDGSYDRIYKARITSAIEYEQNGKVMRGSDKKGKSKKLRGAIWFLGETEHAEDKELFYEIVMDKLIINLPEVWELLKNR
jgi:hypothetical protein